MSTKLKPKRPTSDAKPRCALCGRASKLRECYFFKPQTKFDASLFVPRLTSDELYRLKSGFNSICENRTRCRRSSNKKGQR